MTSSDANVRMMTAPAPTPAYQEDNVAKLQRVSITHRDASVVTQSLHIVVDSLSGRFDKVPSILRKPVFLTFHMYNLLYGGRLFTQWSNRVCRMIAGINSLLRYTTVIKT